MAEFVSLPLTWPALPMCFVYKIMWMRLPFQEVYAWGSVLSMFFEGRGTHSHPNCCNFIPVIITESQIYPNHCVECKSQMLHASSQNLGTLTEDGQHCCFSAFYQILRIASNFERFTMKIMEFWDHRVRQTEFKRQRCFTTPFVHLPRLRIWFNQPSWFCSRVQSCGKSLWHPKLVFCRLCRNLGQDGRKSALLSKNWSMGCQRISSKLNTLLNGQARNITIPPQLHHYLAKLRWTSETGLQIYPW